MTNPYQALSEPDVAAVTYSGLYYKCYSYLDTESGGVFASLFVEQEHGQDVLVKSWRLHDGTNGNTMAPLIVATPTKFIVMHAHIASGTKLRKHSLELSTLHSTGWVTSADLNIHTDALFDIHTLNASDAHVVAYKAVTTGNLVIARYNDPTDWIAAWANNTGDVAINCIGVWGDDTLNAVYAGYQLTGTTELWYAYGDAAGSTPTRTRVFTANPLNQTDWTAVGLCARGTTEVVVVGEGRDTNKDGAALYQANHRLIACRRITLATGAVFGNQQHTYNLSMLSRPWCYAGDEVNGANPRVYCAVGFRSLRSTFTWEQSYGFIVDLDAGQWGGTASSVRPLPCSSMNLGNVDGRPHDLLGHGAFTDLEVRRASHLPHVAAAPDLGPGLKTRTIPMIAWGRMTTVNNPTTIEETIDLSSIELQPITAKVVGYQFHHEEPWMTHRDVTDPAAPSNNAKIAYPWTQNMPVEVGRVTAFGGGTPKIYDGEAVIEIGYCWFPEIIATSTSVDATGVEAGTYQYTVVAEWRDLKGQLHRSAPCTPVEITLADTRYITLTIRSINLSMKESHHYTRIPKIDLIPYRTKDGGSIFYRCFGNDGWNGGGGGQVEDTPANDPTEPWITVDDYNTDTEIGDNDILSWQFLNGAWTPLEPIQPPALPILANWRNRLWGAGGEYPGVIWYSFEILPEPGGTENTAPEFHPSLTYRLDSGDEQVTGMHAMDSLLVVFTDRNVYALMGQGADLNGAGASLDHKLVASGTGCIEPRSVVHAPIGVFFQSAKGYYLLSRTLELEYISAGGDIEEILRNSGNIRSATLLEDRHQIRLVLNEAVEADPRVLIYDYLFKAWSRVVFDDAIHATAWRAQLVDGLDWRGRDGETVFVALAGTGLLVERADDADAYKDSDIGGTAPVVTDIRTGWIRPGPEMGKWHRIRSAILQVEKANDCQINIDIDYEINGLFDATWTDTLTSATGGNFEAIRIRFSKQKCSAFRLRIYENGASPETENFKILSLTLEYGTRTGHKRIPDANVAS